MYLHEDRETFRDLILQVADKNSYGGREGLLCNIDTEVAGRKA